MQNRDWLNELSIYELFVILKNKIIWILLTSIIFGVASWLISTLAIKPKYTSNITMYVYSNTDRNDSDNSISSSDISASKSLVDTYIVILKSKTVLDQVKKNMNLDMTYKDLYDSISASSVNQTEVFSVSVTVENAQLAADIANQIAQTAPAEIVRVVKAGGVEIVDYAEPSKIPTSPNVLLNILFAVIIGAGLSFLSFLIHDVVDTRINSKNDLINKFAIPVLGEIPKIEINKKPNGAEGGKVNAED